MNERFLILQLLADSQRIFRAAGMVGSADMARQMCMNQLDTRQLSPEIINYARQLSERARCVIGKAQS